MKNNFYIYYFSSVHISRKNWHTLLNTCFHIAMTTAIYAGGIRLNNYPVVCQAVSGKVTHFLIFLHSSGVWSLESQLTVMQQVAIALHYSSLSTLLWFGISARVIYKEAVWRLPQQLEGESPTPEPPQRPMLRSVNTAHLDPHCIPGLCCSLSIRI